MAQPLSDEPTLIIKALTEIEAMNARIGSLESECSYYMDQVKAELLPPKESGSEAQRKIALDGLVSPVKRVQDALQNLQDAIKTRITLGQSILKFHVVNKELNVTRRPYP